MRLFQQLKTVPLFIDYFLKAVDEHSVHAPFAFEFYNELRKKMKQSNSIDEIEKARKINEKDNTPVDDLDLGTGSRVTASKKISTIAKHGISSTRDCIFIRELANIYKPRVCIELGTSLGIATSYLAKSKHVEDIYTFEGSAFLVEKASQLFRDLNIKKAQIIHGNIDQTLPGILSKIEQIDLAIIDANHTEKALVHYFGLLKSKMSLSGIVVVDDIRWSTEMYCGWKKVAKTHEVTMSIELLYKGVLFFEKGLRKQHYVFAF